MAVFGGQRKPGVGAYPVEPDSVMGGDVHPAKRILRGRFALACRAGEPVFGLPIIRRPTPAVIMHPQIILRLGMVLFRRLAVQPYGQRHVSRHVLALHIDVAQGELGQRIAGVSRAAVPLHRLIDVARQAAPGLVHGSQNVLGFGVVVIGGLPVMGRRRRHAALARQRHCLAEGLFRHDRVGRYRRRGRIDPCGPARRAAGQQSECQHRR